MKFEELIEEYQKLKKAHDLLEKIYIHVPIYGPYEIKDQKLMQQVKDYFEFDDSE